MKKIQILQRVCCNQECHPGTLKAHPKVLNPLPVWSFSERNMWLIMGGY